MPFEIAGTSHGYDAALVIANTTQHLPWVLLFSTCAFIGGFVQMIAALYVGFKHKSHGIPLTCVTWFFAHDTTYFLNYRHWFQGMDFWMSQGAWFTMGFYMITELIVMYQVLRFSRAEVFPGMSFVQALCSLIGLQILAFALFWWFMSMINDPLYLICFASTWVLSPLYLIPMMRARASRKGFNLASVGGVALLIFTAWPWMFIIEPYFRQPMIAVVALADMAVAAACVFYYLKLPEYAASS